MEMRVYVGTYSKYNNGSIAGKWLDLSDYDSKADFIEACLELHKDETDPELMFQDWEGIHNHWISECSIDTELWDVVNDSSLDIEAVNAYMDWMNGWDAQDFMDKYVGQYDSFKEYAEELFEQTIAHEIPEKYHGYFDMDAYARDLGYDYHESNGYVFHNC